MPRFTPYNPAPDTQTQNPHFNYKSPVEETKGEGKSSNFFIDAQRGVDINRTSLAFKALGETVFSLVDAPEANNNKGNGLITQSDIFVAAATINDTAAKITKSTKPLIPMSATIFIAGQIPEKGITKGEMLKVLHDAEGKAMDLDLDHDGYLSEQEQDKLSFPINQAMEDGYAQSVEILKSQAIGNRVEANGAALKNGQKAIEMLPKTLKEMDADHDGSLSVGEARKVMKEIKEKSGIELEMPNFKKGTDEPDIKPPLNKEPNKDKNKTAEPEGMLVSR